MSDPKRLVEDPNEVVRLEDGSEIRPGRFLSDGEGVTISEPGEEPEADDQE